MELSSTNSGALYMYNELAELVVLEKLDLQYSLDNTPSKKDLKLILTSDRISLFGLM